VSPVNDGGSERRGVPRFIQSDRSKLVAKARAAALVEWDEVRGQHPFFRITVTAEAEEVYDDVVDGEHIKNWEAALTKAFAPLVDHLGEDETRVFIRVASWDGEPWLYECVLVLIPTRERQRDLSRAQREMVRLFGEAPSVIASTAEVIGAIRRRR
jgi:hypothetical protein